MKKMMKKLLTLVMVLALTLGIAVSAMALSPFPDSLLRKAGLNPDKAVILAGPVNLSEGGSGSESRTVGKEYARKNEDGKWVVDLSGGKDLSKYKHIIMIHGVGDGYEWKKAPNGKATWESLSPFWLVGEKKSSSSGGSSSGSSSKHKSPKTGMDSSWMLWLMAAGVFAGSSAVLYDRRKR